MKKRFLKLALLCIILALQSNSLTAQSIWNKSHLKEVKKSIQSPFYATAFQLLQEEADNLLAVQPLSVVQKQRMAASGNKHDYMSLARYFWPDPTQPNGLPYITKDGQSNPEINQYDRNNLGTTANRIITLSLAWYFSDDERYAQKATELIRAWFLNKDTYMNPHLEYAQIHPGHNANRGFCYGIIDSYSFVEMLDAVQMLEQSKSFTKKDSLKLKKWFAAFTDWLLNSALGQEDARGDNNHSIAYDAQVVAYALYTGRYETARRVVKEFPVKRIFKQIEPDGKQPRELARTLAFHYSEYNLTHCIDLYLMAQKLNMCIDNATSSDGRGFYKALDFLTPYLNKEASDWPYQQISGWEEAKQNLCKDLYRCGVCLNHTTNAYRALYQQTRIQNMQDRFNLTYYQATEVDHAFAFAQKQLTYAIQCAEKAKNNKENAMNRRVVPRSENNDGTLAMVHPHDWCSGFFAGSLWQMAAYTHDSKWRELAISWTWPIEEAKSHKGTHDLGFMMNNSFGKAYQLTGERSYKDVVIQSAKTLISRYNPRVRSIRSWDHNADVWHFPVIIDNMMNLEMLFSATQLTGDSIYWKVAVNHANTTLKNHFRENNSSYHVVDYDPHTGQVRMKCTCQGYADNSYWSRGQAWGLYGFAMCYRYTHNEAYLKQSEKIADFILSLPNMPSDLIPYWDMNMPSVLSDNPTTLRTDVPRDASAAVILASGLYELSGYVSLEKQMQYRHYADTILKNINKGYLAPLYSHNGFLLLHSTGNYPSKSEIDVPLNYADYYYLEAMSRKDR